MTDELIAWMDPLCDVWKISGEGFQTVKSYKLLGNANFPESIEASTLAKNPIAFTIPAGIHPKYSMGNKHLTWRGVTEFHVSPDNSKSRIPGLMPWYGRILRAAAANVQLGGTAANFVIVDREDGIHGPREMKYGAEPWHWGFVVYWMVEQSPDGAALPVSA